MDGGALDWGALDGGPSTRARAHGGCGGGSRCLYCSGRYWGGREREKRSWLRHGTVGGWRAGRARHVALGCETIHVRLWHLGTLGTVESCYLFVVIDGVVARELQGTCRQGGEVAHAAARYNFSRYGNFLYKRLVRHTIWRHITYASRPHECRVMVAMVTFRLASARGVTFGMDRFGRSSTATLTHLLQPMGRHH